MVVSWSCYLDPTYSDSNENTPALPRRSNSLRSVSSGISAPLASVILLPRNFAIADASPVWRYRVRAIQYSASCVACRESRTAISFDSLLVGITRTRNSRSLAFAAYLPVLWFRKAELANRVTVRESIPNSREAFDSDRPSDLIFEIT